MPYSWMVSGCDRTTDTKTAKFMGPTWGPPGSSRSQMGPMLAPGTLLSGQLCMGYAIIESVAASGIWLNIQFVPGITLTKGVSFFALDFFCNWVPTNFNYSFRALGHQNKATKNTDMLYIIHDTCKNNSKWIFGYKSSYITWDMCQRLLCSLKQ